MTLSARLFWVLGLLPFFANAQLIINEVSQGSSGVKEYVEFVVIAPNVTCQSTCVDLRGWIIDDNNGFHATGSGTGIAGGCIRLSNAAQWQCVAPGTIILVYNDGDKNTSISLANDPTDSNNDSVYILPISSPFLEGNNTTPSTANSSYAGLTYSTGQTWTFIGMSNSDDCFHTVDPQDITVPYHSVCWGNNTQNTTVYFSGTASNKVMYNANSTNTDPFDQNNWASSTVPTNETPGSYNNAANQNWIRSLRSNSSSTVTTQNNNVNICQGQSYFAGGANQTNAGTYRDTLQSQLGCDSLIRITNLAVTTPVTQNLSAPPACDSVTFAGYTFRNDTIVRDTLRSFGGCDSVIRVLSVTVRKSKSSIVNVCINQGASYFAGGANQTASGIYTDAYPISNGCDSVVVTNLNVIAPVTQSNVYNACQNFVFKGQTYTNSTVLRDTLISFQGCDSVYVIDDIRINAVIRDTQAVCINNGDSYFAGGAAQTTSGVYRDTLQASQNCDSIVITFLQVITPQLAAQRYNACGSFTLGGVTYTTDIIVKDTVLSILGCDSIYTTDSIFITTNTTGTVNVCIQQGESYFAGGANQTTSGNYIDTLISVNGCDSILTTNLTVVAISSVSGADVYACKSYTYNGVTYTADVTLRDTSYTQLGCIDSVTSFNVVFLQSVSDTLQYCINPGETFVYNGVGYTQSAIINDTLSGGQNSCDTIRTVVLTLIAPQQISLPDTVAVESIVIGGVTFYNDTILNTVVLSSLGCDSVYYTQKITVKPKVDARIYMPNVFTPNGDGNNDLIYPIWAGDIDIVYFKVFNRWGELVFNANYAWDGTFKGEQQPVGVYVYIITYRDIQEAEERMLKGSLTLVR